LLKNSIFQGHAPTPSPFLPFTYRICVIKRHGYYYAKDGAYLFKISVYWKCERGLECAGNIRFYSVAVVFPCTKMVDLAATRVVGVYLL